MPMLFTSYLVVYRQCRRDGNDRDLERPRKNTARAGRCGVRNIYAMIRKEVRRTEGTKDGF